MKQGPVLGLAGLFLIATAGCELHRPYCGRCLLTHDQSEIGYRPKTVVTMRAEALPDAAPSAESTSGVQQASASAAPAGSTTPAPMVTVTIPAMKIVLPVNALTLNKGPAVVKGTAAVTQLPPVNGAVASPNPALAGGITPTDKEVRTAVHKEEEVASPIVVPRPPSESLPESPAPAAKPDTQSAVNSENPKKKVADPLRPSKLSLLPPDPPEVPGKLSTTASDTAFEIPPPPPAISRKASEGPSLPTVEPGSK